MTNYTIILIYNLVHGVMHINGLKKKLSTVHIKIKWWFLWLNIISDHQNIKNETTCMIYVVL